MALGKRKFRLVFSGILSALTIFSVLAADASSPGPDRKNILVISTMTHPDMPFFINQVIGMKEAFERFHPGQVEVFQEFMDLGRLRSTEYINSLPDYYKMKYASIHFDAIFTLGDETERLAAQMLPDTFRTIPPNVNISTPLLDFEGCIDLIVHLQPDLKELFVIEGSHPVDKGVTDRVRKTERNHPALKYTYIQDKTYDGLISTIRGLPAKSAILFSIFSMDKNGSTFVPAEIMPEISLAANCPIYGAITTMGNSIVGGTMLDFRRVGFGVGRDILKVLYGEGAVKELPAETEFVKQVDERQMLRWGLRERDLPPGYKVVNRVPSLWRDHRGLILAVFLLICLESSLIFSLLAQRRRKQTAESRLLGALDELVDKQKQLSGALVQKEEILESLIESKTTLQAILSSMPAGVLILEADSGRIMQANTTAEELFGKGPEELSGKPCPGCCNPCVITESNPDFLEAGSASFERCIHDKDGKEIFLFKTVAGMELNGKLYIVECFQDITERKMPKVKPRKGRRNWSMPTR